MRLRERACKTGSTKPVRQQARRPKRATQRACLMARRGHVKLYQKAEKSACANAALWWGANELGVSSYGAPQKIDGGGSLGSSPKVRSKDHSEVRSEVCGPGSDLDGSWHRTGTAPALRWHAGTTMVQQWHTHTHTHGTTMVQQWHNNGTTMVQKWHSTGTPLVQHWSNTGTTVVLHWYYHGSTLVLHWCCTSASLLPQWC